MKEETPGSNGRWEPPSAEELQALIPNYTIEKQIGRGGMGVVYRGVQTNLDRPVAIKVLPPGIEKEDPSNVHGLLLRRQSGDNSGLYQLRLYDNTLMCQIRDGGRYHLLSTAAASSGESTGEEYTLEFAMIGSQFWGRLNNQLLCFGEDTTHATGVGGLFVADMAVRDIEVINLDGLPEPEALRIVGVDEKGNDLRALAAQSEQRQREQSKASDAITAIPELKVLHEQFLVLKAERVTRPFATEVATLNTGYLGGIERAIAEEKAAGHLDGVIALEAERKLVTEGHPVPARDEDGTTEALKKLRGIYREAHAKCDATRAANLASLTEPLDSRLRQLVAVLTQQDRIADAKTVREYREGLESAEVDAAVASVPAAPDASGSASEARYPKGDDRKAAEWTLRMGGKVTIREDGKETTVTRLENLPEGKFDLIMVTLDFDGPNQHALPFENLDVLAGLVSLERLETKNFPVEDKHMAVLASLPEFRAIRISDSALTDEFCQYLSGTKTLERLTLSNCRNFTGTGLAKISSESLDTLSLSDCNITDTTLAILPQFKGLKELHLTDVPLTDAVLPSINELRELHFLKLLNERSQAMKITPGGLEQLKSLKKLSRLGWTFTPGSVAEEAAIISRVFPDLISLYPAGGPYSADDIAALARFRKMNSLGFYGSMVTDSVLQGVLRLPALEALGMRFKLAVTDAGLAALAGHKSLESIVCTDAPEITDAGLLDLAKLKSLQRLDLTNCPKITTAGLAAFKKLRPDVSVKQ